jgi:hypothetical protein
MAIGNLTLDRFLPSKRDSIIVVLKLCTCRMSQFNDLPHNMFKDFETLVHAELMQLDMIVQTSGQFGLYVICSCHEDFVYHIFVYYDLYINKVLLAGRLFFKTTYCLGIIHLNIFITSDYRCINSG